MAALVNKVRGGQVLPWDTLKTYQANDLKENAVKDDKTGETEYKREVQKLKNAIINKGFCFPFHIWADHQYIIDGAGRIKALTELQADGVTICDLPIVEIQADSYEQAKQLVLMASSEHGKTTKDSFAAFIKDMNLDDIVDNINLPDVDLDLTIEDPAPEFDGDADDCPEMDDEQPFTQPGDVYELGNHRLMCGDSCNIDQIKILLNGVTPDLAINDPPYGVAIVANNGKVGGDNLAKNGVYAPIEGDETTQTAIDSYHACVALAIPNLIFWGGNYYAEALPPSACWLVWDKRDGIASNNFADVELAWTNSPSAARLFKHLWSGMIKASEHGQPRVHPTQKPVALYQWILTDIRPESKTILDLFGGSGSSIVAAEQMGRKMFMMEKSEKYCDIIIARMKKLFPHVQVKRNGEVVA